MNFGLSFSYVFQDPEWFKKVALTGLITLIPIVGPFYLIGWILEITKGVIQDNPSPLPEINFGGYIVRGLKAAVIALVYSIPAIIFAIPFAAGPVLGAIGMDADTVATVSMAVSVCCGLLIFIYEILVMIMLPAAWGKFLMEGESIGAGLKVGDVFQLVKAAPGAYLIAILGMLIANLIAPLGSIACVVGILITQPYANAIMGHLYGQAYKQAKLNQGF